MFTDDILDKHPGPITGDTAKKVTRLVGIHFHNITSALHDARSLLSSLGHNTTLVDENGQPCNVTCVVDKTKGLVKNAGNTARKSLLKLGLRKFHTTTMPSYARLPASCPDPLTRELVIC